ncbi:cytochrome P450 3A14-like [Apostichopus japonicus]|uniref:cytochrome P450 3A14-like n=1 Tax=Stichopus japonicus TaxID=307972 RepID=UPI003AB24E6B
MGSTVPALADKRASKREKRKALVSPPDTTFICDTCTKDCHSRIGLYSHGRSRALFGSYSMEVVASVFFGLQVDCQSNSDDPFTKHAREAFRNAFGLPKLYDLLGVPVTDPKIKRFFLGVIAKALELREKGEVKRMDIL